MQRTVQVFLVVLAVAVVPVISLHMLDLAHPQALSSGISSIVSLHDGNGPAPPWHDGTRPAPPWRDGTRPAPPWHDGTRPAPPWHGAV
jgi:hypothetical protein